jgi:large subunit ribosomal protein L18Ae
MKRQNKIRSTHGEIVSLSEIFERKTNSIKNYGLVLKYESRRGMINMYKEYRANSLCNAMSQLHSEMTGRHSARLETIHIIKTTIVANADVRRDNIAQFTKTNLRFPKITSVKRAPTSAHYALFTASRPNMV